MKKKPYKYLKFYHECMQDRKSIKNHITHDPHRDGGLCNTIISRSKLFPLVKGDSSGWWGYSDDILAVYRDIVSNRNKVKYGFTPLRQNIVLLMAAMNGEL